MTTIATSLLRSPVLIGLLLLSWVAGAGAQTGGGASEGPVLLTVRGADASEQRFDRARLAALPQVTVRTTTPWTEGLTAFTGPLARDVLAEAGIGGTRVQALAINDYAVEIPVSDFEQFSVIIAMARNGKSMRVRDRGPLWVIYPWSDHPELRNERYHGRSIWQLKALTVE